MNCFKDNLRNSNYGNSILYPKLGHQFRKKSEILFFVLMGRLTRQITTPKVDEKDKH